MKNAVVVPHGGISLSQECRVSIERYCERFGLASVFLPENKINARGPGKYKYGRFEKLQAYDVFDDYERIMLLDADTLITDLAQNVFDCVASDYLGVVREDVYGIAANRRQEIKTVQSVMGDLGWCDSMFNSGVIVASRQHRDLWKQDFQLLDAIQNPRLGKHKEQKIVNWRARKLGFKTQWLDPRWNYLRMYESDLGHPRTDAYVIHYAGRKNRRGLRSIDARILEARYLHDSRCQMRKKQVEWIIRHAGDRMNGKVLFFGSGYDSAMWSQLCDVTFLEQSSDWYQKLFDTSVDTPIKAYLVNYGTQKDRWESDLRNHVINTLPREVNETAYDMIIVDGPRGKRSNESGRVSPILHAKRLLKDGGCLFVDDMGRTLERNVTQQVWGSPTALHRSRSTIGYWDLKSPS